MRMFAGPNGSGKSTLKTVLSPKLIGCYINPDDIEKEFRSNGLDLNSYGVSASQNELRDFFRNSTFLKQVGLVHVAESLQLTAGRLTFTNTQLNSYCASVIADFIRRKLIESRSSFTFETVMSSDDKVSLLEQARSQGYRTYLYYIATDDPMINILRVRTRVASGGHDVPEDKIVSRYARSLDLLMKAIQLTDRAFIFDNSNHLQPHTWIAEITDGHLLELKPKALPSWFKRAVLDKMNLPPSTNKSEPPACPAP
jgi:predicted ABC-type ATPase